jgi:glutaminase
MANTKSQKCFSMIIALIIMLIVSGNVSAQKLSKTDIETALKEAYAKYQNNTDGKNADYIPALAEVDSKIYGIALITVDGTVYTLGDISSEVSIQSVSKVFTLASVIEDMGAQIVADKVGVDATGMKFNNAEFVERNKGKQGNPLVNAGAIATTSMIKGADYNAKWNTIMEVMEGFAGDKLEVNQPVYESEAATNQHNQALAFLMASFESMSWDNLQTTDLYTKQCAINVNAKDLGNMAATLANGGVNPVTKKKIVSPETVSRVLPVMTTAGLYDDSGIWFYNTGVPAKSGVGGGLIAVVPGMFGIAVVAPPLDDAGNSVKGQLTIKYIIEKLGANPYLIQPK